MSELKPYIGPHPTDHTLTEYYLKSEADKVIEELKADYNEACGRLQTANLIKDEQLAATRHQKYKRCLAMAKAFHEKSERMYCEASTAKVLNEIIRKEPKDTVVEKFELWGAIASTHCKRWLELAEKFKEVK